MSHPGLKSQPSSTSSTRDHPTHPHHQHQQQADACCISQTTWLRQQLCRQLMANFSHQLAGLLQTVNSSYPDFEAADTTTSDLTKEGKAAKADQILSEYNMQLVICPDHLCKCSRVAF